MPQRRRATALTAVAAALAASACQFASGDEDQTTAAPDPAQDQLRSTFVGLSALSQLLGTWRWTHLVDEPSLRRTEQEQWQWRPSPGTATVLHGRYLRTVTVRSSGLPFACNQSQEYEQRATFEVEARPRYRNGDLEIVETGYQTEPSPCDHGFRRLGSYRAIVRDGRVDLVFPEGRQALWKVDDQVSALQDPPWIRTPASSAGTWQWSSERAGPDGMLRREQERWEIAVSPPLELRSGDRADQESGVADRDSADAERLDAIYVRRVTISSADHSLIPCANASSYGFEDRYILDGKRSGELIAIRETAVAAGQHACLRQHSERSLDTGSLERRGRYLVIDWRGKRRQVLRRASQD
jgi:hypothetical protein